jgi:hypothetical protein
MMDGWLKEAGILPDGVAHKDALTKRDFDASLWSRFEATQEGFRAERAAASGRVARLQRTALFCVAFLFACATALLLLSVESDASAPEEGKAAADVPVAPAEKPAWLTVVRPIRLFALEAPELIKTTANYDAIRSARGDGREDNLSFGSAARGDAPFMRVSIYRAGAEIADPAPLFVDLSRRAAKLGLAVAKVTPGEAMRSKFGEMETVEMRLKAEDVERSCLAFRRAVPGEALRISGWYCAPVGSFAGRAGLTCLIDRLALLSAGEDKALRDSFVAAERRRPVACGKTPYFATAGGPAVSVAIGQPRLRGTKAR